MATTPRPAFSLRLSKPETQRAVRVVAKHRHISINQFVEEAIEAHLLIEAPLVEQDLRAAIDAVQTYTDQDVEDAIQDFAYAEVTYDDLLRPEGLPPHGDPFGVRSAFGLQESEPTSHSQPSGSPG